MNKVPEAKNRKALLSYISKYRGLRVISFVSENLTRISPSAIWKHIARYDTTPVSKKDADGGQKTIRDWVLEVLDPVVDGNICYISLGGFGNLPWLKIELVSGQAGLVGLWEGLDSREIVVMDANMSKIVGLLEEEYEYQAFFL